ncbi:MAG: metal-sensitive transcriptional regulator [Vulcanimicrobiota bacterium]
MNEKKPLMNRLKRLEGQVRGVERLIGQEAEPGKVLQQISAIRSGLNRVGLIYAKECISGEAEMSSDEDMQDKIDVLFENLLKYK